MKTAILYMGIAAIGYIAANAFRKKKEHFKRIIGLLPFVVTMLVFLMGFRIGENREVTDDILRVGIASLVMALGSIATTILFLGIVRRKTGYDRYGRLRQQTSPGDVNAEEEAQTAAKEKPPLFSASTIRYLVMVVLGFLLGYFLVTRFSVIGYQTANAVSGVIVTYGLYLMVFLVGMDLGFDVNIFRVFRNAGIRALAIPLVTAAATLVSVLACASVIGLSIKEACCIACTFGWYSLGPNIIMEAGMVSTGAYAFLTNFLRDMISLLIIPWVAGRFGYIETIGLPQAASMDVCIATIESATNKDTAALAFFSGAVFTIVVPVLLPVIAFVPG